MKDRHALWPRLFGVASILTLALTAACASAATPTAAPAPTEMQMEATATGGMDMSGTDTGMDMDHQDSEETIPNDGAVVRIVSPADGATVSGGDLEVKIEVENFPLGEDGRHWHVYIDGDEVAMVEGKDTSYALHGIAPGEHELKVNLANGQHQNLEDGATLHFTVSQ
jgi:hypothetical protein